jgi:hypothetical protein
MQSERNHLLLSRRKFLTDSSIALAAFASSSVVGASRFASAGSATTEIVEVETAYGRLGGRRNGGLITPKLCIDLA